MEMDINQPNYDESVQTSLVKYVLNAPHCPGFMMQHLHNPHSSPARVSKSRSTLIDRKIITCTVIRIDIKLQLYVTMNTSLRYLKTFFLKGRKLC